jgi:hypothetical protein
LPISLAWVTPPPAAIAQLEVALARSVLGNRLTLLTSKYAEREVGEQHEAGKPIGPVLGCSNFRLCKLRPHPIVWLGATAWTTLDLRDGIIHRVVRRLVQQAYLRWVMRTRTRISWRQVGHSKMRRSYTGWLSLDQRHRRAASYTRLG